MNEAYNMDCMEAMKQMPDKYFDLAVVDPPYGIGVMRPAKKQPRSKNKNAKVQVGGGFEARPKATTRLTTQSHRMRSISPSSNG